MEPFKILVKNTPDDYRIYIKYFLKEKNPLFKQYMYFIILLIAVYMAFQGKVQNIIITNNFRFPETFIGSNKVLIILYHFFIFLALLFLIRYLFYKKLQREIKLISLHFTEKEFLLFENEVIIIHGGIEIKINYSLINNCKKIDNYCYLYIIPEIPYIIPNTVPGYGAFLKILSEKTSFTL
jgi:hypothetical protein